MQKYDYLVVSHFGTAVEFVDELKKNGADGWELGAAFKEPGTNNIVGIFKRPVGETIAPKKPRYEYLVIAPESVERELNEHAYQGGWRLHTLLVTAQGFGLSAVLEREVQNEA